MITSRLESCAAVTPLRYRIEAFDPKGHCFRVGFIIHRDAFWHPCDAQRMQAEGTAAYPEKLTLHMAAWIPGSYMIREFAKHVLKTEAFLIDPQADPLTKGAKRKVLRISKTAKARWEITGLQADAERLAAGQETLAVYVEAIIYAWDLSVRAAHLDQSHGFFNPTSLCFRLEGAETLPCDIDLIEPDQGQIKGPWEVATTLQRLEHTPQWAFGTYRARNYDDLADHPVEMGSFSKFSFQACGLPHWLVVTGRHRFDASRVCHDLKKICETQIYFFDAAGNAPFEQFMFLLTVLGEGYGGLEHRDSTALICKRDDLPAPNSLKLRQDGSPEDQQTEPSEAYQRFLGLASHEYFHAWHVKRIKPAVFVDYDFAQENYTRLLWIFEGFTSYYDDLMLLRAHVISKKRYLKALESTMNQVLRNPSRSVQSLADASFDAWIKYYRQDENAANALVSYYAKGAVVALCIDLLIRKETRQEASLDDVMRFLWQRYGKAFYTSGQAGEKTSAGLEETGFLPALFEACGIKSRAKRQRLARQIDAWVESTAELPLERLLASAGVKVSYKRAGLSHGMRYSMHQHNMVLSAVLIGSAAYEAGLSAGDQIIAIDGLRASESTLKEAVDRCESPIEILAFRRDELFRTTLKPSKDPHPEVVLEANVA